MTVGKLIGPCTGLAIVAGIVFACSQVRPPPPAHLDPDYADAGPPILLHESWPQTGPFHCHGVAAATGERATMCSRTAEACATWRATNQRKGFEVGACSETLEASCFVAGERELCFGTFDKCEEMRGAMEVPGMCKTIRAVWEPG